MNLFGAIEDGIPGVSAALKFISNPYTLAAAGAVAATAAIVKCTQKAAEWHEKMAEINVTAEKIPVELQQLSDQLLNIGGRNSNNLNEVPKAFSAIIGAIGDTDKSLATLEPTLRAAKAGFVDVETAARAGTSLMMAAGVDAQKAFDTIVATVKEGNAGFADVANYMPKVVPMARSIGLELGETAGAFAQLTKSLKPEAAATALEGVMRALSNNNVVKNFKGLVIKIFDDKTGQIRPIVEIIEDLNKSMNGLTDKQKMIKFSNLGLDQSATLGISSMMQNVDELKKTIDATTNSAGALETAFNDAKTPMDSWRIIGNQIQVAMIKIGEVFLPIVEAVGEKILEIITYLKNLYNQSELLQEIVAVIGNIFKSAFMIATIPIKQVITLIKEVGLSIMWAWEKLKEFGVVDWFKKAYNSIRPILIYKRISRSSRKYSV
jgi:TP901 family phage tail tape measure protein